MSNFEPDDATNDRRLTQFRERIDNLKLPIGSVRAIDCGDTPINGVFEPWWGRVLYFDIAFFLKQDSVEFSISQIHLIRNYDPTGQAKPKNRRPDSGWSLPLTGILGGAAAGEIKGEGPLRMDQPYSRQVSTSSPSIPRIMGPHL